MTVEVNVKKFTVPRVTKIPIHDVIKPTNCDIISYNRRYYNNYYDVLNQFVKNPLKI